MNVKEWSFIYWLIEEAMRHAYRLGQADGAAGKSKEDQELTLGKSARLLIRTNFEKITKTR